MIYNENKWNIRKRSDVLHNILLNSLDKVDTLLDEFREQLYNIKTNDKYGNVYNKLNIIKKDIEENRMKVNKEDIELILLNNKDILKDTFQKTNK